tara:strand:- start:4554 stop:7469 length:2916 start_codon:yes stop_codon:yes gene_type:complete
MASVRPDQLSGVATIASSDILIAEVNPNVDSRKVVKITKSGLLADITGESTTASNIGTGSGLISGIADLDIRVKSLIPGRNIHISGDASALTIHSNITGEATTASNIGTGSGLISGLENYDLKVKSLIPGDNIQISGDSNSLTIHSSITGEATTATNIGTGSGIVSGLEGHDIKVKSLIPGNNIQISGTPQSLTISSTGSTSTSPFSFFSNALNNAGIIEKTYYSTPTASTYLSGIDVDSASDITLYMRWDGPDDSYMGSASINGQSIPTGNITELGAYTRRFEGYISGLDLAGTTVITGTANGHSSTISLQEAGAGPTPLWVIIPSITGATPKAGTNLGTTDLKGGDSIDIYATFNTADVTGIKVYNSGISDGIPYTSYSLTNTGDGNHTATIPIVITDARSSSQGISVVAQNNFGTAGDDKASSTTISLDQVYPSISASDPTSYNGRTDGLRSGESTTFANTISNWTDGVDYISYSGSDQISVAASGTYQNPKTVSYVTGIYNNSDNLEIYVSRTGNGATDTDNVKIKIANGPVITGIDLASTASSASSPNIVGSTEIKGGDTVDAEVYVNGNGVAGNNITLYVTADGVSNGTQQNYSTYSYSTLADGSFKYTVPVTVTSSSARDGAQGVTMKPRNNFGTIGDEVSSAASATVNNSVYPLISIGSISYPASQEALKDAESATVANTISNFDSVVYSSPNSDLSISNTTTYETSKTVSRAAGSYNISSDNFRITATKTSNGRVVLSSEVVQIANASLSFTISNLAGSIASESGTTVTDNFNLVSNQLFSEIPSLALDAAQTIPSTLTILASGVGTNSNNYRLGVTEADTKGSFTFAVSGRNLAGRETTVIGTNPQYVLSGFAERVTSASPVSLGAGLAPIGTMALGPSTIVFENISEGGPGPSGGTIYTYQSYADGISLDNTYDVDNKFTVCNSAGVTNATGDYVFNLDKLNRAANTSVANPAKFVLSQP